MDRGRICKVPGCPMAYPLAHGQLKTRFQSDTSVSTLRRAGRSAGHRQRPQGWLEAGPDEGDVGGLREGREGCRYGGP